MSQNKRQYLRISTVLPVEFCIVDDAGNKITPYFQGFTNNIGKGGMCLVVNDLWWGFADRIQESTRLFMNIGLELNRKTFNVPGKVAWKEVKLGQRFNQYVLGIEFDKKYKVESKQMLNFAIANKAIPWAVGALLVIFIAVTAGAHLREKMAIENSRAMLKKYKQVIEESSLLKNRIKKEKEEIENLLLRQKNLQKEIIQKDADLSTLYSQYESIIKKGQVKEKKQEELKAKITVLEEKIKALKEKQKTIKTTIDEQKKDNDNIIFIATKKQSEQAFVTSQIINGMYRWIKNRQNLKTGLVLSYEGSSHLKNIAYTYDQSLAAIVFMVFGDDGRAEKILSFYLNKLREEKNIYNAYYTNGQSAEYKIHSGVNAWLGIAALQYTERTKTKKFLPIINHVEKTLYKMMDKEGGIKGGPQDSWYSTEHNLDAYAFFRLLNKIIRKDDSFKKIKNWISKYAYTENQVPINRGKGDSTIATDTYAWSITALGPKTLKEMEMDPDLILKFAANNCKVKTMFEYDQQKIPVEGFDFAKSRNAARGGVISCEWTAQMILAYQIMANFYQDKNKEKYKKYADEALFYAIELQKMIITSPSFAGKADPALPYASAANIDTGHGWRTPAGDKVGSLSATAYFLIAYRGYNPLQANELEITLKDIYKQ